MLELGGWVVHAMHCCLGLAQGVGSRGGQISLMLQNGRGQRALRVLFTAEADSDLPTLAKQLHSHSALHSAMAMSWVTSMVRKPFSRLGHI